MERTAAALLTAVLACGQGEPSAAVAPGGPPASPSPSPGEKTPPASSCHVEADLAAPEAGDARCPPVAPLPDPFVLRVLTPESGGLSCGALSVDGSGAIASYRVVPLGGGGYWRGELWFFRNDGGDERGPLTAFHRRIAAGSDGFLAYLDPGSADTVTIYDHLGTITATATLEWPVKDGRWYWPAAYLGTMAASPDGEGGVLVARAGVADDGGAELWAERIGADARLVTPPFLVLSMPAPAAGFAEDRYAAAIRGALGTVAIGVDGTGRILVAWNGSAACGAGTYAARWFAADGSPLGPVFRAATGVDVPDPISGSRVQTQLVRLPDGSLALRQGGTWLRRFADGIAAGGPLPAWLAARQGETLEGTPRPGLFAAIRPSDLSGTGDRRPRIDVVSASGQVCGSSTLDEQPAPSDYGLADDEAVGVGVDGTVFEWTGAECPDPATDLPSCTSALVSCLYRVWPRALR